MDDYTRLTHDEILKQHAERYARMTPAERIQDNKRRYELIVKEQESVRLEEEQRIAAQIAPRDRTLANVTLGEAISEVGKEINGVVKEWALVLLVIYIVYKAVRYFFF